MRKIKALVVDDHVGLRRYTAALLASEPDIEVVGEAADGAEGVSLAAALAPDLVLMDVQMPGVNGIAATQLVKKELPAVKVIILSMCDLPGYREAAMASGASGYVVKVTMMEELLPTIRSVCRE
jgi:DNA-binding NarL/FixJ family response regulator